MDGETVGFREFPLEGVVEGFKEGPVEGVVVEGPLVGVVEGFREGPVEGVVEGFREHVLAGSPSKAVASTAGDPAMLLQESLGHLAKA